MDCRLIIDEPAEGSWNMALDEALMLSATEAGQGDEAERRAGQGTTLRFYRWAEPTVSLGYFQNHADRESHAASKDCPLVRRATGGGAIIHDRELTYSFTTPSSKSSRFDTAQLYDAFHATLVEELHSRNVNARLCVASEEAQPATEPFLCFQRRTDGDVLLEQFKVCGSAQRRSRGAVLQHGSILLETSANAPELSGIRNLSTEQGRVGTYPQLLPDFIASWTRRLQERLILVFHKGTPTPKELEKAGEIQKEKFASAVWTLRR